MNTFNLKLIAPDNTDLDLEASQITLPTPNGQITILPNHAPLISLLAPGEIILKTNNKEKNLFTEGGIVEIANNSVKILVDTAEEVSTLDEFKIEQAKKEAEELLAKATNDVEYAEATAAFEKQLSRLNVLKRRKKYK